MLKLNNTFYTLNGAFYKIIDKHEIIDYYLLVRTIDDPDSGEIEFIICTGLENTGIESRIPTYDWKIGHKYKNFQEVSKIWNILVKINTIVTPPYKNRFIIRHIMRNGRASNTAQAMTENDSQKKIP